MSQCHYSLELELVSLLKSELKSLVTGGFHAQAENFSSHVFNLMNNKVFNKFIYRRYNKGLYQYCDAVHYPTQFIRDLFENHVGATNGYVISNGP